MKPPLLHTTVFRALFLRLCVLLPFLVCSDIVVATDFSLNATHLLLDGSLADAEVAQRPYVYNNFREAVCHITDSATLYIAPYVYWIDNPDSPKVVTGKDGREPFGMVIHAKKLHFIGLSSNPADVVLASQRGQMQGAVGNFTMFDFHVDTLTVENLTMGNYCNVDLNYPLRPELSRSKRSDAITQAHVGYVHGQQLIARNVRFISRLNLNPLNGARQSYYEDCHFECTDDALNGNAVYRHCTIDLYGSKPFWSTYGRGAMFIDCDFTVRSRNREMYFMKQGGPLTLIGCRYHAPSDSIYIGWTPYPQTYLRCYQQNFTLNGHPYTIGHRHPDNTITLTTLHPDTITMPPYVAITPSRATLRTASLPNSPVFLSTSCDTLHLQSTATHWRIPAPYSQYVSLRPLCDGVAVVPTNFTDETAVFCIEAYTDEGYTAACELTIHPSQLPPPTFLRKPRIKRKGKLLTLDYRLDLQGRRDNSLITWLRDDIPVSVSHDVPQRTYLLTPADYGHTLTAQIAPRHHRSTCGPSQPATITLKSPSNSYESQLTTDFHDFPCQWQPRLIEGYWTVDGCKPADTQEFEWSFDHSKPMWEYAEGFNGAVGRGLLQAQRGARLMYTPLTADYGDMSLTLKVDPTKTAGQGFGSATGQYMDVCLKFDTRTLTGYGLRIIRTTKHAKAVDFLLVEYDHGQVFPLTDAVSATCYRTGCTITLTAKDSRLTAHVETTAPVPADSSLPNVVDLSTPMKPSIFGGVHIQHTGSCGESTTMLHQLSVDWLPKLSD